MTREFHNEELVYNTDELTAKLPQCLSSQLRRALITACNIAAIEYDERIKKYTKDLVDLEALGPDESESSTVKFMQNVYASSGAEEDTERMAKHLRTGVRTYIERKEFFMFLYDLMKSLPSCPGTTEARIADV